MKNLLALAEIMRNSVGFIAFLTPFFVLAFPLCIALYLLIRLVFPPRWVFASDPERELPVYPEWSGVIWVSVVAVLPITCLFLIEENGLMFFVFLIALIEIFTLKKLVMFNRDCRAVWLKGLVLAGVCFFNVWTFFMSGLYLGHAG